MYDEVNFDAKFKALGEYYHIGTPQEIKNFLKINDGIFSFVGGGKAFFK